MLAEGSSHNIPYNKPGSAIKEIVEIYPFYNIKDPLWKYVSTKSQFPAQIKWTNVGCDYS